MLAAADIDLVLDDLAGFEFDPVGFVLWAFPWGEPGTTLADEEGPEAWQIEHLERIGQKLREGGDAGAVIEEDVSAGHGAGKALAATEPVLTPGGWREIGSIKVGDLVATEDGSFTKVIGVYPQGIRRLFRVTLDDGCSVLTDADHQWTTTTRGERKRGRAGNVRTTAEIADSLTFPNGPLRGLNHRLPNLAAIEHQVAELPVEPYLLGVWLGDGDGRGRIGVVLPDKLAAMAGATGRAGMFSPARPKYGVWQALSMPQLEAIGQRGCRSAAKFIPARYLHASVSQRVALLQGILDTDGTIGADNSAITFDSMSEQLADGVSELVRSLGGVARRGVKRATLYGVDYGESYRVYIALPRGIAPFRIACKANRYRPKWEHGNKARTLGRFIESVEYERDGSAVCIRVEHPSALFVTRDHILTHNSCVVAWVILWAISTHEHTRGVVTANTDSQLRTKTWAELSKWHAMFIAKDLFTLTATAIYSADAGTGKTWRIDQIPWSIHRSEAFAGLHNKGKRILVVFDEASAIDDMIWDVTEGALTDAQTQIIWCRYGNPTRTTGRFHRKCTQPKRNHYMRVDSRTVRFTNKGQIQAWIDEYGEDSDFVRVRVKGQFPRAGTTNFISPELAENARRREVSFAEYTGWPMVLSVDPARFGDDFSVITLRQGLKVHWQRALSGYDGVDLCGRIMEITREHREIEAIVYDAIGNGADLDSALRRAPGLPDLIPVMWGIPAKDEKQYFNLRAECWGRMREWLASGDIPDDDSLINELCSLDYGYDARFRIQLASKKDIKRNGGKSPDRADSLALSYMTDIADLKGRAAVARPVQKVASAGWT